MAKWRWSKSIKTKFKESRTKWKCLYKKSLLWDTKPKEQPTENMYEIIKQLKLVGINLNQIARKANALDIVDAPFYKKVYEKWNKLSQDIKKRIFGCWKVKMATTSIWAIKERLDHVIDYTTNPSKTSKRSI